jgi:hypothetical protein
VVGQYVSSIIGAFFLASHGNIGPVIMCCPYGMVGTLCDQVGGWPCVDLAMSNPGTPEVTPAKKSSESSTTTVDTSDKHRNDRFEFSSDSSENDSDSAPYGYWVAIGLQEEVRGNMFGNP